MQKNEILKLIYQFLNENNFEDVAKIFKRETKTELQPLIVGRIKENLKVNNFDKAIKIIENNQFTQKEKELIIPQIRMYQIYQMLNKEKCNKVNLLKFIRKISQCSYDKTNLISKTAIFLFKRDYSIYNNNNKNSKTSECELYNKSEFFLHSKTLQMLFNYIDLVLSESTNPKIKTIPCKSLSNQLIQGLMLSLTQCKYHNVIPKGKMLSLCTEHKCEENLIPHKILFSLENDKDEIVSLKMNIHNSTLASIGKSGAIYLYNIRREGIDVHISLYETLHPHLASWIFLLDNNDYLIVEKGDEIVKIKKKKNKETKVFKVSSSVSYCFYYQIHNEEKIIIASVDKNVYLYNLTKGDLKEKKISIINQISYSSKSEMTILASCSLKRILIYQENLEEKIYEIKINETIISIEVNSSGEFLLVNSSNSTPVISLYNLLTRELVRKFFGHRQRGMVNQCRFCGANENFISCGGDRRITIWNRNYTVPIKQIEVHSGSVNDLIWKRDMKELMISCSSDGSVCFIGNKNIGKVLTLGFPEKKRKENWEDDLYESEVRDEERMNEEESDEGNSGEEEESELSE